MLEKIAKESQINALLICSLCQYCFITDSTRRSQKDRILELYDVILSSNPCSFINTAYICKMIDINLCEKGCMFKYVLAFHLELKRAEL